MQTDVGTEFKIRRRTFAYVFAVEDPSGRVFTMLSCRAEPEEREVLLAIGHPFFAPRGHRPDRCRARPTHRLDRVSELVTESYRLLAPKQLAALVETPPLH